MTPVSPRADRPARPQRLFAQQRCPFARRLTILTVLLAACVPALTARSAGLAFLPGADAARVLPATRDLSLPAWELPGGVLVADRLEPGDGHRLGTPFTPAFADGEWFLVQEKGHAHGGAASTAALAAVGRVHLAVEGAWVVEVPAAGQEAFAALGLCRQRIRLDAPPAGWDRAPRAAAVAPGAAKDLALKTPFVAGVAQDSIFKVIREISGNLPFNYGGQARTVTTRYYNTAGKTLVADYLAARLAAWGYNVVFQPFTYNGVACRNVVATKTGTTKPGEYFVVGGHYDSTSQVPTTTAPGAEDNASGTALVMELARLSAGREFERSLQFVLFDAEERGLIGSEFYVSAAVAAGRTIVGALVHDMVSFYGANYAMRIEGQTAWEPLMSAMATNVTAFTNIAFQKDYYSWGSDHVPFQQAGIPAFLAIDYDYDAYTPYHRSTDTWAAITATAPLATQICRAGAGLVADMGGLLPDYVSGVGDALPRAAPVLSAAPNPFNPRVTVSFDLAAPAAGELAVFDLAGRRVRVLHAGGLSAGSQSFTWDGLDNGGRALPSGAYLCRLALPGGAAVTRVSLVR